MAQRIIYSPLFHDTAAIPTVFDVAHADLEVDPSGGADGGPAITGSSWDAYGIIYIQEPLPSDATLLALGHQFLVSGAPPAAKILLGGVNASGILIACLVLLPDLRLAVYAGNIGTLLAVSPDPVATGTPLRLGMKTTLGAGAGGSVEIHVDGVAVKIEGGADPGAASWRGVYIGGGPDTFINHVYGRDDAILTPALEIELRISTNANLDDASPDGDTTKEDLADGTRIPAGPSSLTGGASHARFYGVEYVGVAAGDGGAKPVIIPNGTEYVRNRQGMFPANYRMIHTHEAVNPRTGSPWVTADFTTLKLDMEGAV